MVRLLVAGQHAEGQVFLASLLDLAGSDGTHAVGVEQQERDYSWIEFLLSAGILGLSGDQDLREIVIINQVQKEIHRVILGDQLEE